MAIRRGNRGWGLWRTAGQAFGLSVLLCLSAPITSALAEGATPTPQQKPTPPPRSEILSDKELNIFEKALTQADRRQWSKALKLVRKLENPVPEKLILWRYYQDPDAKADFTEIVRFIEENPDWPRRTLLLRRAEEAMPETLSPQKIISWFAGQEPITGEGKIRLGEAYLELGNKEYGAYWIQDAWIYHSFGSSKERKILSKHKSLLDTKTHAARMDQLLWKRQSSAASRLMPHLKAQDKAVANARLALIRRGSISAAMSNVPSARKNDQGLVYEQAMLHRKAERNSSAKQILRKAPTEPDTLLFGSKWWTERHLLARRAIKAKLYADAYELVANHGQSHGGGFADGEWLAGWIALRFLKDPALADKHFETLAKGVGYPISKSRAAYWRGRALEAAKETDKAVQFYKEAATYATTFYGQLAIEKLHGAKTELRLPDITSLKPTARSGLGNREIIDAIQVLELLDQQKTLRVFVFHLADYLDKPGDYAGLSDLMYDLNHPELGVRVAKRAALKHIFLPERAYPLTGVSESTKKAVRSPLELVLGLSRQESEFNPRAISRAGARGLMQLMPGTAKIVARQVGLPYSKSRLLDDPSYNVTLGSAHLADLLSDFNGSKIMTIASYNAGAHRVRQWVGDYGDPRKSNVDSIDWIEKIPFSETRNYVQRVLENTQIYRARLAGQSAPLALSADIGHKVLTLKSTKPNEQQVEPISFPLRNETASPKLKAAQLTPQRSEAQTIEAVEAITPEEKPKVEKPKAEIAQSKTSLAAADKALLPIKKPIMAKPVTASEESKETKLVTAKTVLPLPKPKLSHKQPQAKPVNKAPLPLPAKTIEAKKTALPLDTSSATKAPMPAPVTATAKRPGCALFIPDATGGGTCAIPSED